MALHRTPLRDQMRTLRQLELDLHEILRLGGQSPRGGGRQEKGRGKTTSACDRRPEETRRKALRGLHMPYLRGKTKGDEKGIIG